MTSSNAERTSPSIQGSPTAVQVNFTSVSGVADTGWLDITSGLSVLTGRNNVGKSRLLQHIKQLPTLPGVQRDAAQPALRVSTDSITVTATFLTDGGVSAFSVSDATGTYDVDFGDYDAHGAFAYRGHSSTIGTRGPSNRPRLEQLLSGVPEVRYTLSAIERLVYIPPHRVITEAGPANPALNPDPSGQDLAQVIYTHSNRQTAAWSELLSVISLIFPEIGRVFADPVGANQIRITFRDRFSGADVPLSGTGTGVEQILYFVAMALFANNDRIFLVDEPHVFLHPGAERELVAFMRSHAEHSYLCATHSPVFIAAARPDATWLVTRDEQGSKIASVFASGISRATIFRELGIDPGEVALAERILFVEGTSDTDIYPILLTRVGYSVLHRNTQVIQLQGAGTARPLGEAIDELERTLRIRFDVCLDGDKKDQFPASPRLRFLPVSEIEGLFLADPSAIHSVLSVEEKGGDRDNPRISLAEVERIIREAPAEAKPSDIMKGLARRSDTVYKKGVHGAAIAEILSEDALGPFRELFADWLAD